MKGIWLNNKTKKKYMVTGIRLDATNGREGQLIVNYEDGEKEFVRDLDEFTDKFKPLQLIQDKFYQGDK